MKIQSFDVRRIANTVTLKFPGMLEPIELSTDTAASLGGALHQASMHHQRKARTYKIGWITEGPTFQSPPNPEPTDDAPISA